MRCEEKATKHGTISDAGFTLLEVLIAVVVFTVAMLGVIGLSGTTWNDTGCSEAFSEASIEASQQLELMFSARYVAEDPRGIDPGIVAGPYNTTVGQYTIDYVISDGAVLPNTKSVQMNVSFVCGGRPKTVRYNYLVPMRQ